MAFAVRIMYHTTLQSVPDQLVFGRDMILNTLILDYWEAIKLRKQQIIDKNNQLKNKRPKMHTYIIREKLSVRNKEGNRHEKMYIGPYAIIQVWTNGNVTILRR